MERITEKDVLQRESRIRETARRKLGRNYEFWVKDVAQDAMIKAIGALDRFDPSKSSLDTWLTNITERLCIDYMKKKDNQISIKCPTEVLNDAGTREFREAFCFDKKLLKSALIRLNERDRSLLMYKYTFKMSGREMAGHLDIPEKSLPMSMMRAKERLKRILITMGYNH
jgi:RNA polymerase sigma-70 factor (ECF subfamily)